jgi:hypothetical protein
MSLCTSKRTIRPNGRKVTVRCGRSHGHAGQHKKLVTLDGQKATLVVWREGESAETVPSGTLHPALLEDILDRRRETVIPKLAAAGLILDDTAPRRRARANTTLKITGYVTPRAADRLGQLETLYNWRVGVAIEQLVNFYWLHNGNKVEVELADVQKKAWKR